ncbi:MAG: DUF3486 family protein [Gammaproteobacteria bacterium]|nr:DUF3486 family protein [Gammaproteobacteria bacterium]
MPPDKPTRGRMGRIQQLPTEIKAYLDRRLREGASQAAVIEETRAMLADLGEPPLSRSGVNRYATQMELVGQRFRQSREVAEMWVARFGEEPPGEVGQLIVQMLHTLAFETTLRMTEGDDALDPDALKDLALAVQRLERAAEIGTKRVREVRREAAEAAVQAASDEARDAGVDFGPDAIRRIREQVYGLYDG